MAPEPGGPVALTPGQQLLWTGQRVNAGVPLYNMIQSFRIHGAVDEAAFATAMQALIEDCDALRLRFTERDGTAYQYDGGARGELTVVDLSGQADPEAALRDWIDSDRGRVFDLSKQAFTSALLKLADDEFVWYVKQHHLITDGRAFQLLYEGLSERYADALRGKPRRRPGPSFLDYARDRTEDPRLAGAIAYWRDKCAVPAPRLVLYGNEDSGDSFDRLGWPVPADLNERLLALCAEEGFAGLNPALSLNLLWAALFAGLLHRLTGERDIRLGQPFEARRGAQQKSMVGLFMEIGFLDVRVDPEDDLAGVFGKLSEELLEALRHVRNGIASAEINRSYDVLLNFVTSRFEPFAGMPTTVDWIHPGAGDREHRLRVQICDFAGSGAQTVLFEYSRAAFAQTPIGLLVEQLEQLMREWLSTPAAAIGALSMLTDEQLAARAAFNDTDHVLENDDLTDALARNARLRGDETAVVEGDVTLGHREFYQRVQACAGRFAELGVGPGERVAIDLPRSIAALTAMWATLHCGASFTPLETSDPPARKRSILTDLQPVLVLADSPVEGFESITVAPASLPVTAGTAVHEAAIDERAIAYMIYTSGSTGEPKAACMTHGGLHNYVSWAAQCYPDVPRQCWPLYSSLAFDLTLTSIFVPALQGHAIRIYPPAAGERDLSVLEVFADDAVDIVKLTPSHLRAVVARGKPWRRIRALILGGEDLPAELARQAVALGNDATTIYNEYGPTEATVGCMIHVFDPARDNEASVPIGTPVWNMRVHLRDESGAEVAVGVPGEMHLSGPQLLREYWRRDELTRQALYPDPNTGKPCYRSGDLALWDHRGQMKFLGRRDEQIKFRGVRIESAEVEAVVHAHPGVGGVHITLLRSGAADRLICYYTGDADEGSLRGHVARHLPVASRPTDYLRLEVFPLTRNGKIDGAALPLPGAGSAPPASVAPGEWSAAEAMLRDIWAQVLHCAIDSPRANFFDLGGDSVAAIRVASRLEAHGRSITPRQVFDHPTIAELAPLLASSVTIDVAPLDRLPQLAAQPGIDVERYDAAFPLSAVQRGILFHALANPDAGLYQSRVRFTLRSRDGAPLDSERLLQAWQRTLEANSILRCELFWREFDEPLQAVRNDAQPSCDCLDLAGADDERARQQLEARLRQPIGQRISLQDNRLLHLTLICMPDGRIEVVWEVHHILLDGWSAYPLIDEWLSTYARPCEGVRAAHKTSYAQFVAWLQGADTGLQRDFWSAYLGDLEESTRLTREVAESVPVGEVERVEVRLPRAASDHLRGIAAAQQITLSSIFHAAWGLLLSFHTDRADVVFGTTVSGRGGQLPGLADMTGLCLNTLPVRLRIDESSDVRGWLRRVHGELMSLIEFEHTPLPLINQCVDAALRPVLFDTVITIENYPREFVAHHGEILASELSFFAASHYPLDVLVYPEDELRVVFEYRRNRIGSDAVEQLSRQLPVLLDNLGADLARPLIEVTPFAAPAAPQPRSHEPGDPALPDTVPTLIRRHAAAAGPAIVAPAGALSYADLWRRAQAWGRALAAADAGSAGLAPVAVAAHRHPDTVVAMLACLIAGRPFLPINPDLPAPYVESLLARLSIGQFMAANAPSPPPWTRACQRIGEPGAGDDSAEMSLPGPSTPAYVIHTSGSTGTPKSVPIDQAQLAWSTRARLDYYGTYSAFLLVSPLFFDSAFAGLWGTLAGGGTVVLPDDGQAADPRAWREAINAHRVTHTLMLPSAYRALLDIVGPGDCRSLAGVMLAGEACPGDIPALHFQTLGETRLFNEYGPTEATVWSHVSEVAAASTKTVPIGYPLPHVRQRVVDRHLRPALPGVAGELLLGGPAVIERYLDDSTAADCFVRLADSGSQCWYRTGDKVRLLPDGQLEFVGRVDRQVKIRGQRVDPLETEALIQHQPGVRECAVAPLDEGGRTRLCAWVVAEPSLELADLREAIERQLPPAARPGRIVTLADLPRTPNRKVDYRQLQSNTPLAAEETPFDAPRGEAETLLASVWRSVLDLADSSLSRQANFVDLGGDSLAAMRAVAQLYRAGFDLGMDQLVSDRSLADIAVHLVARADSDSASTHRPFDLVDLGQDDLSNLLEEISD